MSKLRKWKFKKNYPKILQKKDLKNVLFQARNSFNIQNKIFILNILQCK